MAGELSRVLRLAMSGTECSGSDMLGELLRGWQTHPQTGLRRLGVLGPNSLLGARKAGHRLIMVCRLELIVWRLEIIDASADSSRNPFDGTRKVVAGLALGSAAKAT
jgi:hypothetical protein